MSRYVVVLALILTASTAGAQSIETTDFTSPPFFTTSPGVKPVGPSPLMTPLYTSFAGLTAADGYLTWRAIHRGAEEKNGFVAPIAGDAAGLTGLKIATGAVTLLAVERLRRDHPRAAIWMMVAANTSMVWVVWHNTGVAGLR